MRSAVLFCARIGIPLLVLVFFTTLCVSENITVPNSESFSDVTCASWPSVVLVPAHKCPVYLQTSVQEAGTAHSFMSLMGAVDLAAKLSITLNVNNLPKSTEHNILFDLMGGVWKRADVSKCSRIASGTWKTVRQASHMQTITTALRDWKHACDRTSGQWFVWPKDKCAIINVDDTAPPTSTWSVDFLRPLVPRHFAHPDDHNRHQHHLTIAVHIRRGDLSSYIDSKAKFGEEVMGNVAKQRLVPNIAYTLLIDTVLKRLRSAGYQQDVHIRMEAEGSPEGTAKVLDVNGTYTNYNEISEHMRWNKTSVVVGSPDPRKAFTSMCEADVLITGASGFSHLAGLLCPRPIILAVPFWIDYTCVPNAIMLNRSSEAVFKVELKKKFFSVSLTSSLNLPCDLQFDPLLATSTSTRVNETALSAKCHF